MKKSTKRVIRLAVLFCVTVLFLSALGVSASAETASISTDGNIEFDGGTVGIYVDDFHYLQEEITELFNEIAK